MHAPLKPKVLFALVPAQLLVLVLLAGSEALGKPHKERAGLDLEGGWKEMGIHGTGLALAGFLLMWGARQVVPVVWTGIEVLILPAAILAEGEVSFTRAACISLVAPFLVGLSLFGKSASVPGCLGVVLSVTIHGASRRVAHRVENQPFFFLGSSIIAFLLSATIFATLLLSSLLSDNWFSTIDTSDVLAIGTLIFAAPFAQFASYASSQSTPPPLPLEIIPRNLAFLLIWAVAGSRSNEIAEAWLPFLLIYTACTILAFDMDRILVKFAGPILGGISRLHHRTLALPTSPSLLPSLPPTTSPHSPNLPTLAIFLSLTPLLLWLLLLPFPATRSPSPICTYLPTSLSPTHCSHLGTVDIVISYYDEPLPEVRDMIAHLRTIDFISVRQSRFLVYAKGGQDPGTLKVELGVDEVVPLTNVGREGATYLRHILSHYPPTALALSTSLDLPSPLPAPGELADHTIFIQHHISWGSLGRRRLELVVGSTGFLSFGPYRTSSCGGEDSASTGTYPHIKDIYETFRGEVCPGDQEQLTAWAAQFVVSKRRILANGLKHYQALGDLIEAPAEHWIHREWGPNDSGGPSNPTFGHALERSWPIIFDCVDPAIAARCGDRTWSAAKCQCFD